MSYLKTMFRRGITTEKYSMSSDLIRSRTYLYHSIKVISRGGFFLEVNCIDLNLEVRPCESMLVSRRYCTELSPRHLYRGGGLKVENLKERKQKLKSEAQRGRRSLPVSKALVESSQPTTNRTKKSFPGSSIPCVHRCMM